MADQDAFERIPTYGRFSGLDRVRYPSDLRNLSVEQLVGGGRASC
jgi:hypothetical protein